MSETLHKVLIVDDEEQVLDGLKRTLRHESLEIVTTTSPTDALKRLDGGQFDILISDIDMPEMTGLELISRARKDHPEVVRILLTGDSSLQSALTAINDGAVHKYLSKPWRASELRETLRTTVMALGALREQAHAAVLAEQESTLRRELEENHPGISATPRVEGAYLLNDMRVVELLYSLGDSGEVFAASRWLPVGDDATFDLGPT